MDFLQNIVEDTLLIVPNNIKDKVLKEMSLIDKLINIKIYSFNDLRKYIFFDYDYNAVLYLMDKYGYKYEVAKNYIENMYYLENDNYVDEKLKFLFDLKNELIDENLLDMNDLFLSNNFNKKVIIFGYDYINKFNKRILNKFSSFEIIDKKKYNLEYLVYDFNNLEEELLFVIEKIIEYKEKNISLNDIYLVNVSDEYNSEILRLFNLYNIPVDISISSNMLSIPLVKDVISRLTDLSFVEVSDYIKENYDLNIELNSKIYNNLISIFNKYIGLNYSFSTIYEAIIYDLKNTVIEDEKHAEYVHVSNIKDNYYPDNSYVFLVGCNQGVIPKIYKDEEYISDRLKGEIDIETVDLLNLYERESIVNSIKSIRNLIITYKKRHMEKEYFKSNLLELDFFQISNGVLNNEVCYSSKYAKLKLAKMLDELIKFGNKDINLSRYFNTLDISYMKYNNYFSGIDKYLLREYLNKKLVLSYTSIESFYKCQFRYYLDNILKLNKYEETFNTFVGNLFHFILSRVHLSIFDLDNDYDSYIKNKKFSNKELFFLDKLKKELVIVCNRIKKFNIDTGLANIYVEKIISVDKSSDIEVIFKGIVDKIMYKDYDDKTLVSVVDYKTGSVDVDIHNSVYGLGMQLIIYLYLITKSNLFDRYEFVGFYLQKILSNEVNIDNKKNYIEIKNNNLKLQGYSTEDLLSLERFDPTYEDSEYIQSMKYSSKGFSRYAKVLSSDCINSLINLVDEKIIYARDKILEGDFSINPKKLNNDKDIVGCKFCSYRDICFRKNEDIVNLEKYNDLSFLKEGEKDA